jgi:hypothetical protein
VVLLASFLLAAVSPLADPELTAAWIYLVGFSPRHAFAP